MVYTDTHFRSYPLPIYKHNYISPKTTNSYSGFCKTKQLCVSFWMRIYWRRMCVLANIDRLLTYASVRIYERMWYPSVCVCVYWMPFYSYPMHPAIPVKTWTDTHLDNSIKIYYLPRHLWLNWSSCIRFHLTAKFAATENHLNKWNSNSFNCQANILQMNLMSLCYVYIYSLRCHRWWMRWKMKQETKFKIRLFVSPNYDREKT